MATDIELTTFYPCLQVTDPRLPSLSDLPTEIVILILEAVFDTRQIIIIDISGPKTLKPGELEWDSRISRQTQIVIRPPPLYALAAVSRLFQYMYRKSRPTLWGAQLFYSRSYYVDLSRDIFYVRVNREVHPREWDRMGNPHTDALAGVLTGIELMATSNVEWDNIWAMCYLRHLNPLIKQIIIFFPTPGIEDGHLELSPVLVPLNDNDSVPLGSLTSQETWERIKAKITQLQNLGRQASTRFTTPKQRELWEQTWRLAPIQELKGYTVDEERLKLKEATDQDDSTVPMLQLPRR